MMLFPPINQIPFTTLHEINLDWLLNELVSRFNAVVNQFNQIVEQFNGLSNKVDDLEKDYTKFKKDTEELLEQIQELADKLTPETVDELLSLVDDFSKIQSALDKLEQDLTAEATTREAADTTLQANIDAEKTAREAADTTLQANIDAEKTAREAADKTLQDQIDTLTEGSGENAGAIGNLRDELAAEKTARESKDTELEGKITANTTEITDVKTTLQNEIEARQDGDSNLQSEIATLTTAVQDETAARESADNTLQSGISSNSNNISSLQTRVTALEQAGGGDNTLSGFITRRSAITDTVALCSANNMNTNIAVYLFDVSKKIKVGTDLVRNSILLSSTAYLCLVFSNYPELKSALNSVTNTTNLFSLTFRVNPFNNDLYRGNYEPAQAGLANLNVSSTLKPSDIDTLKNSRLTWSGGIRTAGKEITADRSTLFVDVIFPFNPSSMPDGGLYNSIVIKFPGAYYNETVLSSLGIIFSSNTPITF